MSARPRHALGRFARMDIVATDAMGEQLWSTSTLPSDAGPRAKASIVVLDCRERGE
jgi:hypothetical protein